MAIIGFLVFGLVVGALARLIKPGKQNLSIVMTLVLGVVGSLIGGIVASALGTGDIFELNILGAIVAIVAAVLLIGVAEGVSGRSKHARLTPTSTRADRRACSAASSPVTSRPTSCSRPSTWSASSTSGPSSRATPCSSRASTS